MNENDELGIGHIRTILLCVNDECESQTRKSVPQRDIDGKGSLEDSSEKFSVERMQEQNTECESQTRKLLPQRDIDGKGTHEDLSYRFSVERMQEQNTECESQTRKSFLHRNIGGKGKHKELSYRFFVERMQEQNTNFESLTRKSFPHRDSGGKVSDEVSDSGLRLFKFEAMFRAEVCKPLKMDTVQMRHRSVMVTVLSVKRNTSKHCCLHENLGSNYCRYSNHRSCNNRCHDNHKNNKLHFCQCRQCQNTMRYESTRKISKRQDDPFQQTSVVEEKASVDEFFDIFLQHYSIDKTLGLFGSAVRKLEFSNCTPGQVGAPISGCSKPQQMMPDSFFSVFNSYLYTVCVLPWHLFMTLSFLCMFLTVLNGTLICLTKTRTTHLHKNSRDAKIKDQSAVLDTDGEKTRKRSKSAMYLQSFLMLFCIFKTNYPYKKVKRPKILLSNDLNRKRHITDEIAACKLYDVLGKCIGQKSTRKILSLNDWHSCASRDIIAYPAYTLQRGNTLDPILDRFSTSDPPNRHETMSFELLRLCTLHDFPFRNAPSLVRLTQAGFYYEGNDDEVICFSCNVRKRNWNINDDPMDVHRKLSPNCPFVNGTGVQNVPVNSYSGSVNTQSAQQLNSAAGSNVSAGSHQAPELQTDHFEQTPEAVTSASSASMVAKDSAIAHGGNMVMSQTASHGLQLSNSTDSGISSTPTAVTSTTSSSQHPRTAPPNSYQPAGNARPMKYPQYADKTVRLDTYKDWPTGNTQHPRDMTEAGFYFTGNGDCARCFQCGIGLKNWDPLDNPWVEHARWSPRCSYLLEIKGQDFIDLVMDAAERANRETHNQANNMSQTSERTGPSNTAQNVEKDCAPRAVTQDGGTDTDPASVTTSAVRDVNQVPKFPLQAPAAQSIISQGYAPKVVKIAVDALIERIGWPSVTADAILQELNDSGYASSSGSQGASASTTSEGDNFGNSEFKISKDKNILQNENKELKELTTCKICLDERVSIVFLPCGHLVSCAQCAPAMRKCPICRTLVKGTVRTCLMDG